MKKIGVVILSRFNSKRLPGKALREINGIPVLLFIIKRINEVFSKENIIIATSTKGSDDAIANFADNNNINCYRGDLDNVAQRFYEAGKVKGWDYIVRINGDNIFVDTSLLDEMSKVALLGNYNFLSNLKNRTYPKGMSVEIVNTSFYGEQLKFIRKSKYHSEHVTSYLYENENLIKCIFFYNHKFPEAAGVQLALDTQEDLDRSIWIIENIKTKNKVYNLEEIIEILKKYDKKK